MNAVVQSLRPFRPLPASIQSDFLAHVEDVLGLAFHSDTVIGFCDDVKHATPITDRRPEKFWYIARERPNLQIRFGHYPTDEGAKHGRVWRPTPIDRLTNEQRRELADRDRQERKWRGHDRQRQIHNRRAEITHEWECAPTITADFEYLSRKGVAAASRDWRLVQHRFKRQWTSQWNTVHVGRFSEEPALMIPLCAVGNTALVSAEYIAADGEKDCAYGLPTSHAVHAFGIFSHGQPIYLCEGIATAATVHRLADCLALRCGGAGNLKRVAQAVRQHYGADAQIIVCAESGNGYQSGVDAASTVGGSVCSPPFSEGEGGSDFNDFWLLHGDGETIAALQLLVHPEEGGLSDEDNAEVRDWIAAVNQEFCIARWGNETVICREVGKTFTRISNDSLRIALANRHVPRVSKSPHLFWQQHRERREYREVAYDPEQLRLDPKLDKNLWNGWAVEQNPIGSWSLLKKHIFDNVAGGQQHVYDYVIRWMAYVLQHPGRPCGVALVLRGAQGVGKGTVFNALLEIFGAHGKPFNKAEHLTGRFTEHLENVSFVFCDEVGWTGAHEFNDTLKALITERRIQIEPKGRPIYEVTNTLNFGFATNKAHAVRISGDNRRMCVLDVRDAWAHLAGKEKARERDAHFDPLHRQLRSGGYGAMLSELLGIDLTDFLVTAFPRTTASDEQVEMSHDSIDRWITAALRDGVWRLGLAPNDWKEGQRVDKKEMFDDYREFAMQEKQYLLTNVQFWKRLNELTGIFLPGIQTEIKDKLTGSSRRVRLVTLPPLDQARQKAAPLLGVPLTDVINE